MTVLSRRRLQSNIETLLLEFTVLTASEEDQTAYSNKLEQTTTYHSVLESLSNKLPNILSIFIANTAYYCGVGTKQITVAGQHRCESSCGLNQYYDTSSSSCKDQVEFIITTSIKKILQTSDVFGIGVAGWIFTLCAIYAVYRCYVNRHMQSEVNQRNRKYKAISQIRSVFHRID
eukprot:TRINITY_DN241_c0_g1_i1.p1 TRINITY_DN241_c0_g1~~TRINITY_DN241_c0_g1_i1.p1  ORF type:complete len:194 (-),score=27.65 TRINITY_DN241_c0_g1_i1:78-602(-)